VPWISWVQLIHQRQSVMMLVVMLFDGV